MHGASLSTRWRHQILSNLVSYFDFALGLSGMWLLFSLHTSGILDRIHTAIDDHSIDDQSDTVHNPSKGKHVENKRGIIMGIIIIIINQTLHCSFPYASDLPWCFVLNRGLSSNSG